MQVGSGRENLQEIGPGTAGELDPFFGGQAKERKLKDPLVRSPGKGRGCIEKKMICNPMGDGDQKSLNSGVVFGLLPRRLLVLLWSGTKEKNPELQRFNGMTRKKQNCWFFSKIGKGGARIQNTVQKRGGRT